MKKKLLNEALKTAYTNIPIATVNNNGLMTKDGFFPNSGYLQGAVDFNTITDSGMYAIGNNTTGGNNSSWQILIVFKVPETDYIAQFLLSVSSAQYRVRACAEKDLPNTDWTTL